MPGTIAMKAKQSAIMAKPRELQPLVTDLVDLDDAEDVAGDRGDHEDRELDRDRRHRARGRRDQRDDLRRRDRVAVVGVVEQEPAARRAGQGQQQPPVGRGTPAAPSGAASCPARSAAADPITPPSAPAYRRGPARPGQAPGSGTAATRASCCAGRSRPRPAPRRGQAAAARSGRLTCPTPSSPRAISGPTTRPRAWVENTRPTSRPRSLEFAYSLISTALTG